MKKLLFLKSAPGIPVHGADISVFERLRLLRKHGWQGEIISTGHIGHAENFKEILAKLELPFRATSRLIVFSYAEVECSIFLGEDADQFKTADHSRITAFFDQALDSCKPQAILGNARDPVALEYLASKRERKPMVFLTEDEFPRRGTPLAERFFRDLSSVDKRIVATEYLKNSLYQAYQLESTVITNSVDTSLYKPLVGAEKPGRNFITMMHPYPHKGVLLFLEIVEKMPDRRFLLMAGTGEEYRKLKPRFLSYPNLTLENYTKNAREVYQKSRLVLVPSQWQEAFSRVIIEAFCSETPVISSGTGGMRQAGGSALYCVEQKSGVWDLNAWIQAIKEFDDEAIYIHQQKKARARVLEFEAELENSMQRLSELLIS